MINRWKPERQGFLSHRNLTGWQTYQCAWYKGGMKLLQPATFIRIPSVPCTWAGCTKYTTTHNRVSPFPPHNKKQEVNWLTQGQPEAPGAEKSKELPCLTAMPYSHTTLSFVILYISFHFFHLKNSLPLGQTLQIFGQVCNALKQISARIWFRAEQALQFLLSCHAE